MELPFLIKYQPKSFKDYELDDNLVNLLNSLVKTDNLNILLVGNSGSGKSSLIKSIVSEYFKTGEHQQDNILYINSLKEQGIQYYRNEVKCFCQTTSTIHNKKKLIILDDLDIINEQSQQVFRNCIDKYSNNVNFITTCSNTQKILESIQSRLLIIKLKPLETHNLQRIMNKIIKLEKIGITADAVKFTLALCNNSVRLLINYLEKFKLLETKINLKLVQEICTNISFGKFEELTNYIFIDKNIHKAIKIIYDIYYSGYSVMDILDNYFLFIKTTNLLNEEQKYETIKIICKYITIINDIHEHQIELAFFVNNLVIMEISN